VIFVSSSSINSDAIEDSIKGLSDLGIRKIELSGGTTFSEGILGRLKSLKKELSLDFLIHNYFPPPEKDFVLNIASPRETTRLKSVEFIKKSIQWANYLGIDRYSFHAGYARELRPPDRGGQHFNVAPSPTIRPVTAAGYMYESLEKIQKYAEEKKVKVAAENLFPFGEEPDISLLSKPSEIFRFLEYFSEKDHVGLLLDLGHVVISSNYYGFDKDELIDSLINKYLHRIFGIHLSGNDGEIDIHSELSSADWQVKTAKKFRHSGIPVTIECRNLNEYKIVEQYEMLKNALREGA